MRGQAFIPTGLRIILLDEEQGPQPPLGWGWLCPASGVLDLMQGRIDTVVSGMLHVWAWDADRPESHLTVRLKVDGRILGDFVADQFRRDLANARIGDGRHGVRITLGPELQDGQSHLFALEAEGPDGTVLLHERELVVPNFGLDGRVEAIRKGMCVGWVYDRRDPQHRLEVEAVWNGAVIASGIASRPRKDLLEAGIGDGAHGFALPLPESIWLDAGIDEPILVRTAGKGSTAAHVLGATTLPRSDVVKALVAQARHSAQTGNVLEAARMLDKALGLVPDDVDLLLQRATLALQSADDVRARECAERARHVMPDCVAAHVILGRLASDGARDEEALAHWRHVPPGDAAYRESLRRTCDSLHRLGNHRALLRAARQLLDIEPSNRDVRRLLAEAYAALGEVQLALAEWRILASEQTHGLQVAPVPSSGAPPVVSAQPIMQSSGPLAPRIMHVASSAQPAPSQLPAARITPEEAPEFPATIAADPQEAFREVEREFKAENWGAVVALTEPLDLARNAKADHRLVAYRGRALLYMKHFDRAIETLRWFEVHQPKRHGALFYLGAALEKAGRLAEARKVFLNCIAGNAVDAKYNFEAARVTARLVNGDFGGLEPQPELLPEAMQLLRRTAELLPSDPRPLRELSQLVLQTGDTEECLRLLKQAIALAPRQSMLHLDLSRALARLGRVEEALAAAREALALDPHRDGAALAVRVLERWADARRKGPFAVAIVEPDASMAPRAAVPAA